MPSSRKYPAPFVLPAKGRHTHTAILLHGWEGSGSLFGLEIYTAKASSGFCLPVLYPGLKFVFPTAMARFSSIYGCHLQMWFEIVSLMDPESQSELQKKGLEEAVINIHSLIQDEVHAGIPEERIILGGISQGCATALHALLCYDKRLGGFVGMSGWLPFASKIREICRLNTSNISVNICGGVTGGDPRERQQQNESKSDEPTTIEQSCQIEVLRFFKENLSLPPSQIVGDGKASNDVLKTPVFLGHGDDDPTVNYQHERIIYSTLKDGLSMDVTWGRYEGFGHWYKVPDGIDDIVEFWGEKCGLLPS